MLHAVMATDDRAVVPGLIFTIAIRCRFDPVNASVWRL
jgi:hypothetical protein